MLDGTFILHHHENNTTFKVVGDTVEIDRTVVGVMSREEARQLWSSMVRAGAVQVVCHDEDGHDGEGCTCKPKDY